jgi:hypothetical protein
MLMKTYAWGVLIAFVCIFILGTVFSLNLTHAVGIDSEYDVKRFLVIGFIWFASLGLYFVKDIEFLQLSIITKFSFTVFLVLAVCSTLTSQHVFWSMLEMVNIGLLMVAFYILASSMRAVSQDSLFIGVYVSALLFSVFTFTRYILFLIFSYFDAQSFDIHGLMNGYANIRFFNQLQVMIVPLLFISFFSQKLAKFRRVSIVVLALHWMVLLQTEARGAMLSLILAMSLMLYFLSADTRNKLVISMLQSVLIGICLWLIFIIAIPYWLMDSSNFQIRTGSSGRMDLWLYILKSIPERPWLGFGPMSFTWAEGRPLPNAHPHNSVMQLLYEYGVISCIALVTWAVSRVCTRLVHLKKVTDYSSIPVTYAVLSALIYSLASGVVVMPMAQLVLIFLVAMQVQYDTPNFYKIGPLFRMVLFLAVAAATFVLLATYKNEELLLPFVPRIWINGIISY